MYDPYNGQFQGLAGPLGDVQNQVASVLNGNGNGNNLYVPLENQVGSPIVQYPNPREALRAFFAIFRGARGSHR